MNGFIKSLKVESGYGFIRGEDNREYFVHSTGCKFDFKLINQGVKVTFEPTQGQKGPRAENVELRFD